MINYNLIKLKIFLLFIYNYIANQKQKGRDTMEQTTVQNIKSHYECRTLHVEDIQNILGIGRSQAYMMVRNASADDDAPFKVMRLGNRLLISKKSFDEYLEANGL